MVFTWPPVASTRPAEGLLSWVCVLRAVLWFWYMVHSTKLSWGILEARQDGTTGDLVFGGRVSAVVVCE